MRPISYRVIASRRCYFPSSSRIGVPPASVSGIDPKFIRTVKRMEFDPKTVIDIEAFGDRLAARAQPCLLLIGQRNLGTGSGLAPLSRSHAFKALVNYMIVGLGLYQGLEFLLERSSYEVFLKISLGFSRLRNALRLLSRSKCHRLVLGRDLKLNGERLEEFLEQHLR